MSFLLQVVQFNVRETQYPALNYRRKKLVLEALPPNQ